MLLRPGGDYVLLLVSCEHSPRAGFRSLHAPWRLFIIFTLNSSFPGGWLRFSSLFCRLPFDIIIIIISDEIVLDHFPPVSSQSLHLRATGPGQELIH